MKIYEKPMAIIEKINVEDVITASGAPVSSDEMAAIKKADSTVTESNVILFQW